MVGDVIRNEAGNSVIAVVVAFLHSQLDVDATAFAHLREVLWQQLLLVQEVVFHTLCEQTETYQVVAADRQIRRFASCFLSSSSIRFQHLNNEKTFSPKGATSYILKPQLP